jgi:hypothetical protein
LFTLLALTQAACRSAFGGETTLSFVTDSTDGNLFTFAGTGIGFGTLTMAGQVTAVTDTAIAVDLLQAADVSGDGAAEVTLDQQIVLEHFGDGSDLILSQIFGHKIAIDTDFFDDFQRFSRTDAIEVAQRILDALVSGDVHTNDTGHDFDPL